MQMFRPSRKADFSQIRRISETLDANVSIPIIVNRKIKLAESVQPFPRDYCELNNFLSLI